MTLPQDKLVPRDDKPYELIRQLLANGCSEDEYASIRCPVCQASTVLNVHPRDTVLYIRCTDDSTHLSMHVESTNRQNWWLDYVSEGWY